VNELTGTAQVTAESDFGVDSASLEWTVVRHEAPMMTLPSEVRLTLGDDVNMSISAAGLPAPAVSIDGLPAGLEWVPGVSGGAIVGSPTAAGSFTATVTAANGVGDDARVPLTFIVEQPVISLSLSGSSAKPGDTLDIAGSGFLPGDTVQVWLHSEPVLLATAAADASGVLNLSVVIPAGTPAGGHTLVAVAATGATGSAPVTVLALVEAPDATPESPATASNTPDAETLGSTTPESPALASTGTNAGQILLAALLALMVGAGLVSVKRARDA
jgi:LPXTG-motif cell wall-anchored protein